MRRPAFLSHDSVFCALALASFAVILRMAMQGPIFTDELPWLMQNSHMLYDGWTMINMYPACESNFAVTVPWLMMPGRVLASVLHPGTLWGVRLEAAFKYVLCVGLMAGMMRLLWENVFSWGMVVALAVAVLSLGFLPAVYLLDRPETSVMAGVAMLVLMALVAGTARWVVVPYFFVLSWLFSTHPKVQALYPALLVLAYGMGRKLLARRPARVAFMAGTVVMMASGVDLWKAHQTCPDSWMALRFLGSHTVLPSQLMDEPVWAVKAMWSNLWAAVGHYMPVLRIDERYMGLYPYGGPLMERPWFMAAVNVAIAAVAAGMGLLMVAQGYLALRCKAHGMLLPRALPFLLLLAPMEVVATKLNRWSFWETGYLVFMGCVVVAVFSSQLQWHRRFAGQMRAGAWGVVIVAVMSHGLLYYGWKGFYQETGTTVYANGALPNNKISRLWAHFQGIADDKERRARIQEVAVMCDIALDQNSQHVMFDDWTYMGVWQTYQPYYGGYLLRTPPSKEEVLPYLRRTKSSGAVMRCDSLPEAYRAIAKEKDGICCMRAF